VAALVGETAPDLVLLDVRMPELDGLTCLTRLRRLDYFESWKNASSVELSANVTQAR
jgi:CheY-like chemotaxis protein